MQFPFLVGWLYQAGKERLHGIMRVNYACKISTIEHKWVAAAAVDVRGGSVPLPVICNTNTYIGGCGSQIPGAHFPRRLRSKLLSIGMRY